MRLSIATLSVLWHDSSALKVLSSWLQWLSIGLVFVSGGLQVAKYLVDRREKVMEAAARRQKEADQQQRESVLSSSVLSLNEELAARKAEIARISKRTEHIDPATQPIRAGTATVDVTIKSNAQVDSMFMDRGGYIAFGKGTDALMVMSATQCTGKQLGNGQVRYRGVFSLDANDKSIGKPVSFLNGAEYVQLGFTPMPENSEIVSGVAICTINNTVRFEIIVPTQTAQKEMIFSRISTKLVTDSPEPK